MAKLAIDLQWNVAPPDNDSDLYGRVVSEIGHATNRYGKTRAQTRAVRADFSSLLNKVANKVNKERKEADLAPVTSYQVLTALVNQDESSLVVNMPEDTYFAFGRRLAGTVGDKSNLDIKLIKRCASFLAVDFIENAPDEYMTLDMVTSENVIHEADGDAPAIPAGATPIPAEVTAPISKTAKSA